MCKVMHCCVKERAVLLVRSSRAGCLRRPCSSGSCIVPTSIGSTLDDCTLSAYNTIGTWARSHAQSERELHERVLQRVAGPALQHPLAHVHGENAGAGAGDD